MGDGLRIETLRRPAEGGIYTSPARLFLTADRSRVVAEDDPEAAWLLVGEGCELPAEEAARYGLVAEERTPPAAAAPPTEEKSKKGKK